MAASLPRTPTASPKERRDHRLFWVHPSRDEAVNPPGHKRAGKPLQWARGEAAARKQFAKLVAAGKLKLARALADAIELDAHAHPPGYSAQEWAKKWTEARLTEIAERWLLHPETKGEIERQRKIFAAMSALRQGIPADVMTELLMDEKVCARDKAWIAAKLDPILARHNPGQVFDLKKLQEAARRNMEESPTSPAKAAEGGGDASH